MSFLDAREAGAKPGSGGVASSQQEAIDRRERLRRLALETIDLAKDPYYMRNHLGQIECRLCLTLHNNEGNYLAHTQGKRHQQNLAKRAAREAAEKPAQPAPNRRVSVKKTVKIGRPGYRVTKQFDPDTLQRGLLFQIEYPEIDEAVRPRHRFMSAYEQKVEAADKKYQYLLFAADPYETISFKIPNLEVDKEAGHLFTHWDPDAKIYSLQLRFKHGQQPAQQPAAAPAPLPPPPMLPASIPPPPMGMRPPPPPGGMGGGFRPPPPPMMMSGGPPQQQFQQQQQQQQQGMRPPPGFAPPPAPPQYY